MSVRHLRNSSWYRPCCKSDKLKTGTVATIVFVISPSLNNQFDNAFMGLAILLLMQQLPRSCGTKRRRRSLALPPVSHTTYDLLSRSAEMINIKTFFSYSPRTAVRLRSRFTMDGPL